MKQLRKLLATHEFFQGSAPGYLHLIAGCASNVSLQAEHYLFHEGEAAG